MIKLGSVGRFVVAGAALLLCAPRARAQQPMSVIRVRVIDTTGRPVEAVDVAVVHGLNAAIAKGTTDAKGMTSFSVPRSSDDYEIVARRIGYLRGDQFFHPDKDSIAVQIRLYRTPQELAPVEITAAQDLKRKLYHIGADEIAASSRNIGNAFDVVTKLRAGMIDPPGRGIVACGLDNVWINGLWIKDAPINATLAMKTAQQMAASRHMKHVRPPLHSLVPVTAQSILSSIHPEHIAEMTYIDSRDNTLDMAGSDCAVFVVLKPGIGYERVRGTFVAEEWASDSEVAASAAADSAAAAAVAYRKRVLGVFDESTGQPVIGAEVVDVLTGTFAVTTTTGTVSLAYLPDGISSVRIRKPGYAERTVVVSISPRDTVAITVTLVKP